MCFHPVGVHLSTAGMATRKPEVTEEEQLTLSEMYNMLKTNIPLNDLGL